jgi:peptidoglycan/LPS O-acetylase OafA/YrhL
VNPHPTSAQPRHDPALDGLRGLAILLVYIFHYGGGLKSTHIAERLFGYFTASGWIGVELFFALSGFLITGILWNSAREPHYLRNFYARRVLRIFPLYYAALALCAIAMLLHGRHQIGQLYLYAFFLQDLPGLAARALAIPTLPLYHFWSLAVEEQFYLLWPFLLLFCRTRRAALRLCLSAFALSWVFCFVIYGPLHLISPQTAQSFDNFFLTRAGALALGAALAIAMHAPTGSGNLPVFTRFAPLAVLAGLAVYLISSLLSHGFTLTSRLQFTLGLPGIWLAAAAAIPLVLRAGLPRRLFSIAPLCFLGRISYGFYVFHILLQPIFDAIGRHYAHTDTGSIYQFLRLIAGFPITLAVSWVSYQVLELPFLRLKRFFPSPSPVLPAP